MVLVAKSKKSRRRKIRNVTVVTLLILLFGGIIAMFIMLGNFVRSLNTVFPNVWAEGTYVSGLTQEQTRQALINGGYEENAADIAITISLPYDISFTVTGDDVGLSLNAGEASRKAYNYGRDGSFLANTITYIRAYLGRVELNELSSPDYNTDRIRELAGESTKMYNDSLFDQNLEVGENRITIVKGSGFMSVTADEVYSFSEQAMRQAMDENRHVEAQFVPEANRDNTVDLQPIFDYIYEEPVSSKYDPELGDPKSETYDPVNKGATESKTGRTFDIQAAEERFANAQDGETIIIPIVAVEPELSQEQLRNKIFGDVLAEREASQASDDFRSGNIILAAEAIDGLIMQPGEVFSFNEVVGTRTREKGYREANAIINGVLTPTVGGGICQVSSSIYAALLKTDLEIVSRTIHGLRVYYLDTSEEKAGGQDATVSNPAPDFKFRNNSEYPIMLEVKTEGKVRVKVKIHGTRVSDVYYRIESVLLSTLDMETVERPHVPEDGEYAPPGEQVVLHQGNSGSVWEVWRYSYSDPEYKNAILDANGEPVKKLINKDTYPARRRVIIFNPDAPPVPAEWGNPEGLP